jgi:hypothetical protein
MYERTAQETPGTKSRELGDRTRNTELMAESMIRSAMRARVAHGSVLHSQIKDGVRTPTEPIVTYFIVGRSKNVCSSTRTFRFAA